MVVQALCVCLYTEMSGWCFSFGLWKVHSFVDSLSLSFSVSFNGECSLVTLWAKVIKKFPLNCMVKCMQVVSTGMDDNSHKLCCLMLMWPILAHFMLHAYMKKSTVTRWSDSSDAMQCNAIAKLRQTTSGTVIEPIPMISNNLNLKSKLL